MTSTYSLIASYQLSSGGGSFSFTSIPQTYTDLLIKYSANSGSGAPTVFVRFNGDTGSNYYERLLYVNNGANVYSASSSSATYYNWIALNNTYNGSWFSNGEIYIPNYTSANAKSVSSDMVQEFNLSGVGLYLDAGLWNNTNAITSITIYNGTQLQYSTAYLYGIKNS
jgi:hypothetical protein